MKTSAIQRARPGPCGPRAPAADENLVRVEDHARAFVPARSRSDAEDGRPGRRGCASAGRRGAAERSDAVGQRGERGGGGQRVRGGRGHRLPLVDPDVGSSVQALAAGVPSVVRQRRHRTGCGGLTWIRSCPRAARMRIRGGRRSRDAEAEAHDLDEHCEGHTRRAELRQQARSPGSCGRRRAGGHSWRVAGPAVTVAVLVYGANVVRPESEQFA